MRFARVERLATEVLGAIATANDQETIDSWALVVATARLERSLDTLLVILRAGVDPTERAA
jgi:hypothetical protein